MVWPTDRVGFNAVDYTDSASAPGCLAVSVNRLKTRPSLEKQRRHKPLPPTVGISCTAIAASHNDAHVVLSPFNLYKQLLTRCSLIAPVTAVLQSINHDSACYSLRYNRNLSRSLQKSSTILYHRESTLIWISFSAWRVRNVSGDQQCHQRRRWWQGSHPGKPWAQSRCQQDVCGLCGLCSLCKGSTPSVSSNRKKNSILQFHLARMFLTCEMLTSKSKC